MSTNAEVNAGAASRSTARVSPMRRPGVPRMLRESNIDTYTQAAIVIGREITEEIEAEPEEAQRLRDSRHHGHEGQRRWRERDTE